MHSLAEKVGQCVGPHRVPTGGGRRRLRALIKTIVTGNATVAFSASALWHVYSCRTEHVVYLFLLLFNIILLKENFLFII